jgi:hypothetical protein
MEVQRLGGVLLSRPEPIGCERLAARRDRYVRPGVQPHKLMSCPWRWPD